MNLIRLSQCASLELIRSQQRGARKRVRIIAEIVAEIQSISKCEMKSAFKFTVHLFKNKALIYFTLLTDLVWSAFSLHSGVFVRFCM